MTEGGNRMFRNKKRRALLLAIGGVRLIVGISSAALADTNSTWDGSTNNWSSATDWSTNPNYPNNGTPLGSSYDVFIAKGSVTLDVDPTIQTLNFSGGEILGSDSLTIDGLLTWTGGSFGANLELAKGGIEFEGPVLILSVGTLTNETGEMANLGISGSSSLYLADNAIFDNAGTVSATNGAIFDAGGGTTRTVNNSGSLNADDPGGTFQIGSGLIFNNTGTVNAQAGELLLAATDAGSTTGSFSISAGATLAFAGTFTLASTASLAGAGTVDFEGGTTTISTTNINSMSGQIELTGGTLLFNVSDTFGDQLNWTGGVLAPNTGVTLTAAHGIAFGTGVPILDIGTLLNPSGETATMGASGTSNLDMAAGATFDNAGTVSATNGGIFDVGGGIARTVDNSGTFNVSDTGATFQIGSGLMFNNTGKLNVMSGMLAMNATYTGESGGTITVSSGATLTAGASFAQPAGITNNGALVFTGGSNTAGRITGTGSLTIETSTLQLDVGSGVSSQGQLVINGGTLDLTNNELIINYGSGPDPIASIAAWIKNGYYNLPGPQIISSTITLDDTLSGLSYGIGYADSADPGNPANLPTDTIEIAYTLLGDANLDGTVNSEDFTPFSHNLGQSGMMWDDGDFNYDGTVNAEDFTPFSHNLNLSASLAAAAGTLQTATGINLANVPEPMSAGMMVIAGVGILRRRRRSSCR